MAGLSGKNILVTGGAGFIGGHLVEKLLKQGANVFVVDIYINPKSIFAINKLAKKVKYSKLDIRDRKKVAGYFKNHTFEYIFHLAAEPIVGEAFNDPYRTFETNIMGTVNILEEARKNKKIKGIIVASSDKAYGKLKKGKAYKEESPLFGDHPYDVSKSCQDLISLAYSKTYGIPVVVTRFGNVYGEGDLHFDRLMPGICEAIIKNKVFEIRSNGKYVRDYIYVGDVADGYVFLLTLIEKVNGETFNFSSKDNLSVLGTIKTVEKASGLKIKFSIKNNAKNEIPYQHVDDSKIRKLGWRTNSSLETTFPQILKWYRTSI